MVSTLFRPNNADYRTLFQVKDTYFCAFFQPNNTEFSTLFPTNQAFARHWPADIPVRRLKSVWKLLPSL